MVYPKEQLFPSYPNPAFSEMTVGFHLKQPYRLTLDIMDIRGTLVNRVFENRSFGMGFQRQWIGLNELPAGQYLYRLHGEGFDQSQSFIISR